MPANVVIKASNVNAPTVRNAIAALERRALATGQIEKPITVDTNRSGTVANITMPIKGTGTDAASMNALALLRDELIPATVGTVPAAEVGVTGIAARWSDELSQQRSKLPYVVAFVLIFAFCLMLIAFRSIVVALKAIVLNLLSVGAAFGILVLVFQHGVGKGVLGFSSTAGISPVVPMLLFVILFGLSMDYHVFIVSRIRETFDRGASMDDAISYGIKSTAGTCHERSDRHGRGVLDLRDVVDADVQAVRRRAGGRDLDRRHHRSRRAAPRDDEAAGRAELVPAQVARVASAARRARIRARGGCKACPLCLRPHG